jgi:hypothetical protein
MRLAPIYEKNRTHRFGEKNREVVERKKEMYGPYGKVCPCWEFACGSGDDSSMSRKGRKRGW